MDNLKIGIRLFTRLIIVGVLSFFVCFSIQFLCLTAFTQEVGYNVYGYAADQTADDMQLLYTHYFEDGDDSEQIQQYEDAGYTLSIKRFRSELQGKGKVIFSVATQCITLIILIGFIGNEIYKIGSKDSNKVKFGHRDKDNMRGFKIGAIANIGYFIVFLCLFVLKDFPLSRYALINAQFFSIIKLITGNAALAGELRIAQYIGFFGLLLVVPVITEIAYLLGYKGINLYERAVYKKETEEKK